MKSDKSVSAVIPKFRYNLSTSELRYSRASLSISGRICLKNSSRNCRCVAKLPPGPPPSSPASSSSSAVIIWNGLSLPYTAFPTFITLPCRVCASCVYSFSGSRMNILASSEARFVRSDLVAKDLPEPDLPMITMLELTLSSFLLKKSINTGTPSAEPSLIPPSSDI